MKRAALHNLGCKVNAYETEAMQQLLEQAGYEIVSFEEMADVYVINTCSVTNVADQKSRQMLHRAKKKNPNAKVVAVGCYVQTDATRAAEDAAIDLIIGNNQKHRIVELLELEENQRKVWVEDINGEGQEYEALHMQKSGAHTRAFLKVQDGCDQFCSYCVIPFARGRVRSRSVEDVVREVRELVTSGCQEYVLTGIHLSSYGMEEAYNRNPKQSRQLLELIRAVHEIPGVMRIRLGSLEPQIVTEEFARALAELPKICPHFHLSLQSGCDTTLQRMNRHYDTEEYRRSCEILRQYFVQPAITTDVIVGFPGETAEEFARTKAYVEELDFYEMHVFKYSKRHGTKAAQMPDQVDEQTKTKRSAELLTLERKMSEQFRRSYQGRQVEALLEEEMILSDRKYLTGYTKEYIRVALPAEQGAPNQIILGKLGSQLREGLYEIRSVC